ncbi:hypothetical protein D9757_004328 [Collybiopsis confluens]|uniref:RPA43 OB domain-containing protein n=1 Tax=Collybiopsis confluens TaxID=2823264 RepID=A0A8H5MCX4_9AGAR|nr:hypothetical protein D9757_004328 [Collybiopsis confluens]
MPEHKLEKGKAKESAFEVANAALVVSISPVFASNPRAGVEELLDSMIMRYIPALDGVVLSHSNLAFEQDTAALQADCPFLVCKVFFDVIIWRPVIGMKLVGKISLCSPDHISLLVHKTFNVSIPRIHIPHEDWEFQYGPAENDPEFGPAVEPREQQASEEGSGKWIHRLTAVPMGDDDGYLEFTVMDLMVANEMLSLRGSIQYEPFSPRHSDPRNGVQSSEADQDAIAQLLTAPRAGQDSDDEDSDEEDGFQSLNRKQKEADVALSHKKLQESEGGQKKKRKRKTIEAESEQVWVKKKKTGKLKY